jgi:phospholipid-binding lipoprotein MlaA
MDNRSELIVTDLRRQQYFTFIAGIIFCLLFMVMGAGEAGAVKSGPDEESYSAPLETTQDSSDADNDAWAEDQWEDEWEAQPPVLADPLEPINRFFFHFNDKLYYWVLKPVAKAYSAVIPEELQICFRNFFNNLKTPARAVNSLLQGNVRDSFNEVARFTLNSTVGIVGLGDFAKDAFNLDSSYEDLGQTFAHYGAGGGFYINWPFLGPSNLRDSLGLVGDTYLHPLFWIDAEDGVIIGTWTFEKINYTALTLGDYELFTQTALDPYTAVKDAYQQYRNGLIENK